VKPPVKRSGVKKVVFGIAVAVFLATLATSAAAIWAASTLGGSHAATASLFATVIFLACCAIVLYFMSVPPRPISSEEHRAAIRPDPAE
jgi:hypothetical protein